MQNSVAAEFECEGVTVSKSHVSSTRTFPIHTGAAIGRVFDYKKRPRGPSKNVGVQPGTYL